MAGVVGQQIGAQNQNTHGTHWRSTPRRWQWQLLGALRKTPCHTGVVHADFRVIHRRLHHHAVAQRFARTGSAACHGMAQHVQHVFVRSAQPVLKRQKVRAHILRSSRHKAQQLRQAAQHLHLGRTGWRGFLFGVAAAQFFQQGHGAAGRLAHVEVAQTRELHHLRRRSHANHGVAFHAAGLQHIEYRQKMVFQKQHTGDHDVGTGQVAAAARQRSGVVGVLRRGVQGDGELRQLARQALAGPLYAAGQVRIHGHDDQIQRHRAAWISG